MKRTSKLIVIFCSLLVLISAVVGLTSNAQPGSVAGVYENFTVGKPSGDLEGMRVVIIPAAGGHYSMVQIAQGGAEDPKPEFVLTTVKGMNIEFTVGDKKYSGAVSVAGLRIEDPDGKTQMLKRRPCATLFR